MGLVQASTYINVMYGLSYTCDIIKLISSDCNLLDTCCDADPPTLN